MRRTGEPSELGRLAAPIAQLFDVVWKRMHWWIVLMAILYALSGITVIRADEVAVLLRWGRLVGDTPALQEHGPGLLFAFPAPVDQVIRVQTKHVRQIPIDTLADTSRWPSSDDRLDPLTVGYALSGDQNIVHVSMIARYRVSEPAEWAFRGPSSEDVLRVEVTAAMVRSLGEMGIDHVLADGRKEMIATASRRAQAGLDAAHSGLTLVSLELTGLAPPHSLAPAFDEVQSAYIMTETKKKEALAFAQNTVPRAQAETDAALQSARAETATEQARARGAAQAFLALEAEYHANPGVLRERLYRDAIEKAIGGAESVRWIPPPVNGRYAGLRVMVDPEPAGSQDRYDPADEKPL
ncbi:MAG: protease modulator HflK [Planctomycetota bacterium]